MIKGKKIFSKSAIGAVLFAIALWGYTSLNDEYLTTVVVPLDLELPEDRALESIIPNNVTVEVRGSGWNLFNLIFFNTSKNCLVDLRNETMGDEYSLRRQLLVKSVRYLNNVETRDVIPGIIDIKTGRIIENEVDVVSNVEIIPKSGFMISGDVEIDPPKLKIKGNKKLLADINSWSTSAAKFKNISSDFETAVSLSDSLNGIVHFEKEEVIVKAKIQQIAEIIVPDVPIDLIGGDLPSDHKLSSMKVDVVIRGSINELENYDIRNVKVNLKVSEIISGYPFIQPSIDLNNKKLKALSSTPTYIYIYKVRNILNG